MTKHAKYAPSKLSRLLVCSASLDVEQEKSNPYADEGTMLHDVMAGVMHVYFVSGFDDAMSTITNTVFTDEFDTDHGDYVVMLEDCLEYIDDLITADVELGRPVSDVHIEERVDLTNYDHRLAEVSGTPDLRFYLGDMLHVVDWKFGYTPVEVKDNVQLRIYALGAIDHQVITSCVVTHICQPKIRSFGCHTYPLAELASWLRDFVQPRIEDLENGVRKYNPSAEACKWCPERGSCPARNKFAMVEAASVFADYVKPKPVDLQDVDLERLSDMLGKAKEIEQVIKDIKALATQRLSSGLLFPGYKLVAGKANRVWVDENAAAHYLDMYGLEPDEYMVSKLVTPAKAEKLIHRVDRKESAFTELIEKPEGKPTIVPESDKRPALSSSAEETFKHLSDLTA